MRTKVWKVGIDGGGRLGALLLRTGSTGRSEHDVTVGPNTPMIVIADVACRHGRYFGTVLIKNFDDGTWFEAYVPNPSDPDPTKRTAIRELSDDFRPAEFAIVDQ